MDKRQQSCNISGGVSSLHVECETVNFVLYIFFCSSPNKNHLEKSCSLWFILKMWTFAPPGKTKVFQSTASWDQNLLHACGTEVVPHSEGKPHSQCVSRTIAGLRGRRVTV